MGQGRVDAVQQGQVLGPTLWSQSQAVPQAGSRVIQALQYISIQMNGVFLNNKKYINSIYNIYINVDILVLVFSLLPLANGNSKLRILEVENDLEMKLRSTETDKSTGF